MPESVPDVVTYESLGADAWSPELRELLEAVADVASRLDHDVLSPEHLLVVGAENGTEAMARQVANLSAFREALLDLLYDDREQFRRSDPDAGPDERWVRPALVDAFRRMREGESPPDVLAALMLGESPRIQGALQAGRGTDPEIVPPDTQMLERELTSATGSLDTTGNAAAAKASSAAAGPRPEGRVIPLTTDLCRDALDDLPLVGRKTLSDQVARILLRFHEPAMLLVGEPGAGKTAFVRGLARAACTGDMPSLQGLRFHQLRILDLVSQSHRGQDIQGLMSQLLEHVAGDPSAVFVIDDLHLLLARQGYPLTTDLIDTVKLHIKKGKLRALLTVDSGQYERTFSNDSFFSSEITVRRLPPLERDELLECLVNFRPRLEKHFHVQVEDDALEASVAESVSEQSADYIPPGSTIRLLDEACSMARARGEERVDATHVRQAAHEETPSLVGHWDRERLAGLGDALETHVLGQDIAAEAVARRVRLSKLHLDRKPNRPDGVFLFIGPSGVGKTELARALARVLYDDESHLVRLDMSEYLEPHSVARIIGAPPGYVGYGEDGALTGPVQRLGHGVVLLDEIEKAHPQVLNLFLQVFDDGRLTDSKGRVVDFSDTVIIMTSNIGRELYALGGDKPIGFSKTAGLVAAGPVRDVIQEHLLRVLPAEFVNRIDEIVPFRVLEDADIQRISRRLLEMETARWKERGKTLTYDDDVVSVIATSSYDPRLGARHLERNLERLVISLLSNAAVTSGFEAAQLLALHVEEGGICLTIDGQPFQCLPHTGRVAERTPPAPSDDRPGEAPRELPGQTPGRQASAGPRKPPRS
ncbi:MAG: AAA family ATPase [Planctomycetota bacterium]|jgi:ATP-dependent Clp protease ATP-binding subunit ClpC